MALTLAQDRRTVMGDRRVSFARITFDASYPTGGEAFTPGMFGMTQIDAVVQHNISTHSVAYSATTGKLLAYTVASAAQVADTTDLSAITVDVVIYGN